MSCKASADLLSLRLDGLLDTSKSYELDDHLKLAAVEETRLRYDVPWYLDAYVRTLRGLVGTFVRAYLRKHREIPR